MNPWAASNQSDKEAMGVRLIIPGTLPGLNEIIDAAKTTPYAYREMKKTYTELIAWEAKRQKIPFYDKADFTIIWFCPNKRHDKDNIMAGTKFIFDGLKEAGKIKNDGWGQIGSIEHIFGVDREKPRIEVEIREASA